MFSTASSRSSTILRFKGPLSKVGLCCWLNRLEPAGATGLARIPEIQLGLTGGEAGQRFQQIGATDEVGQLVTPSWAISSRVSSAMNLK